MIDQRLRAVGPVLFGLAFATGAWGQAIPEPCSATQTGVLTSNCADTPVYAVELFGANGGDDVVLEYPESPAFGQTGTKIPTVTLENSAALTIGAGQRMELSYTLDGAVFANTVGIGNLNIPASPGFRAAKTAGGARGEKSVTYELTGTSTGQLGEINFRVPPLTMASAAMATTNSSGLSASDDGVRASVVLRPLSSGSGLAFPRAGVTVGTPAVQESGTVYVLGRARESMYFYASPGPRGNINLEQRAMLAGPNPWHVDNQEMWPGVAFFYRSVWRTVLADGETMFSVSERGGAGALTVKLRGEFREDDIVYLDYMVEELANRTIEPGEALTMGEDGTMELRVDLEEIFVDADNDRTTPRTPITYAYFLFFRPNGKDPLRPGLFETSFAVDFERSSNRDLTPLDWRGDHPPLDGPVVTQLMYAGADSAVKAYAIAPHVAGGDRSNVRIRCDAPTDCQVHVACDGADGTHYFGKVSPEIPARGVRTLDTMTLAEVIGADAEEDFAGRMSCEVIGTGINVQVLTRSGGTLVNNTYVGE